MGFPFLPLFFHGLSLHVRFVTNITTKFMHYKQVFDLISFNVKNMLTLFAETIPYIKLFSDTLVSLRSKSHWEYKSLFRPHCVF